MARMAFMARAVCLLIVMSTGLIGLTTLAAASSLEIVPFDSINQSPLVSIYGLPGAGNFLLLAPGRTEVGMNVALSSNYAVDKNLREQITIDGETTRFTFAARHGLLPRLEVGVAIPYIIHGGGFLDGFIESFHSAFGFSQGGRDQTPRNHFLYRYRRDGIDKVRVDSSGFGIGDIRLTTAFQLYQQIENHRGISLNLGIKLPTGNSEQLRGSGSTDLSVWITGGADLGHAAGRWQSYGSAGMLFMTEGDVLPDQQRKSVGFGSLGLGWLPLPWLVLKVQADAHTSFFRGSEFKEIAADAVQFTAGGTIALSEGATLDMGISEDLTVRASPDIAFYLTLRTRF